jgi:hypothetical protein
MKNQIHFEKKFYLDKKNGYWISTTSPRIRAHIWVWNNFYGKIEKSYHVHHTDGNKSNNNINNLKLMSRFEHLSLHANKKENIERVKELCDKIRPLTKPWHCSEEGLEWHRVHGINTWKERKSFKIKCLLCGSEIETKTFHQKFCNQNCKAKYARKIRKCKID